MKTIKRIAAALFIALTWGVSTPALAALAIIAHPSNPLSGITAEQAAQIYLGKVGVFPNGPRASAVDQAANSAARKKFYKAVVKKDDGELKVYWSKLIFTGKAQPPRELGDDAGVKSWIAGNPEGIGYVDGKFVDGSVKVLLIIP